MNNSAIVFLASAFLLASCAGEPKDNKAGKADGLSPSLVNNPRTADNANPEAMKELPTMDFDDTTYNFGNMHEGEVAEHDFRFTNNGKTPLIITTANGSCGCTVPEYPHEPLAPGKSAIMKVKFNSAAKVGHQNKTVSIVTNSNKGTHLLTITAEVIEQKKD